MRFKGSGIVISNHPNTLFDPLHIGIITHRQFFFLANAGLFKHPVMGFLLSYLYCIPIARPGRDEGSKVNNDESFQAAYDHLAKGGILYIAAEGVS